MFRLPGQKRIWVQGKDGNILGSFNLDLRDGLKVASKLKLNTSSDDDADLGFVWGIVFNEQMGTGGQWQVGAGSYMFEGTDLPNGAFTQSDATTPPSFGNNQRPDLRIFPRSNGELYTAAAGGAGVFILALDGSAWTSVGTLTGSTFDCGAPLIYFPGTGRLYYRLTKSSMGSINSPISPTPVYPTAQYALDLNDKSHSIQCGSNSNNWIHLGTIAPYGQKARVHEWNGSSTSVSKTIEVDAQGVLAMCVSQNVNWIIDSNGVLRFNQGGYYKEVARLPFKKGKAIKALDLGNQSRNLLVHYNGMTAGEGDEILINVNSVYLDGTQEEICPSGTWSYTAEHGLVHRGSPTFSTNDLGSQTIAYAGAIAAAKVSDADSNGDFLAGFSYYTDSGSTIKNGIFYNDTLNEQAKAGFLISPKLYSDQIKDTWGKVVVFVKKFLDSGDKVVVKYRTEDIEPIFIDLTYSSSTAFSTETDLTGKEGWEVEILTGNYAGRSTHITAVGDVVDISDTFSGVSGTAKARVSNWKKIGEMTEQTLESKEFSIQKASKWLQLKLWIRQKGDDQIEEILVTNKNFQPAN
jgi:hypothetical protein